MHAYYSIVMWKDVLFAGLFLLLTIKCFELYEMYINKTITFKKMIPFMIISFLCVMFRNNGIYMYMFLFVCTLLLMKKYRKIVAISFLIVICTYFIIKIPVLNYFGVKRSASAEYIAMPLQQIGRMVYKEKEMSQEDVELLNNLMPIETMKSVYHPAVVDTIKFNSEYNGDYFDSHKKEFLKFWLRQCVKHPITAVESYMISTLGYWYPNVEHWYIAYDVEQNSFDLKLKPVLKDKTVTYIIDNIDERTTPIFAMEWSIGLCFWIISIFAFISIKKNKFISIYPYLPIIGIWITMIVASPVYGEYRYVYGAFLSLPLFLLLPYIKMNHNKPIKR